MGVQGYSQGTVNLKKCPNMTGSSEKSWLSARTQLQGASWWQYGDSDIFFDKPKVNWMKVEVL